jgi:hypothetical protein
MYIGRLLLSLLAIVAFSWANFALYTVSGLELGKVAGEQMLSSDSAYIGSALSMRFWQSLGVSGIFLLLFLAALWATPIRKAIDIAAKMALVVGLGLFAFGSPAKAYFEKTEVTEAYTILPNESAFWIPDLGDNKAAQARTESEAFLNENKVALKRFVVPHTKLGNSGGYLGWDYYVPNGRLIIVDRTPFSREWVDSEHRGTSASKEGFPCQSKEGLNITVGVSVGASVTEADAARFLYRFGVTPPKGDRSKGEVIFTSVYYSRSLTQVMDDVGRKKIQTLVCNEINNRTFDQANNDAVQIMETVKTAASDYFRTVGITLDFIGWADTFEFDKDIQKAVNDRYMAEKLAPIMPILNILAQFKVQEGLGKGLADKGPPIVLSPDMLNSVLSVIKPVPVVAPVAPEDATPAISKPKTQAKQ